MIAHFHRTLAIGFLSLVAIVLTSVPIGISYLIIVLHDWESLLYVNFVIMLLWLLLVPLFIWDAIRIFRDSRAIWTEGAVLHYHRIDEASLTTPIFLFLKEKVRFDSISGLSTSKAAFPGAVDRLGIYVDLKNGKSHKVLTFLLREREEAVMAKLREALGLTSDEE